jgi:hypothetical protein
MTGSLRADSAVLPIAYYLYGKDAPENYTTHSKFANDRATIRGWLIRSLLKASGIWGSGLDTLLTALRATLQTEGFEQFPVEALRRTMAARGKTLTFEQEEIEELLDLEYGDRRIFALLSLLYPFVDLRNNFHIDHIFPTARLTPQRLRKAGVNEDTIEVFRDHANRLSNLQLLEGAFNNEKRQKLPADWLAGRYPKATERANYCSLHDLGEVPAGITAFEEFYKARRTRLFDKITDVINVSQAKPMGSHIEVSAA